MSYPIDDKLVISISSSALFDLTESEKVFKNTQDVKTFHEYETKKINVPHKPGLLKKLIEKLVEIQKIENKRYNTDDKYKKRVNLSIITARNAPSHERFVTTLKSWGLTVNTTFFMGGIDKSRILQIMKPHIYFDDRESHLDKSLKDIPLVHIPFGIANKK